MNVLRQRHSVLPMYDASNGTARCPWLLLVRHVKSGDMLSEFEREIAEYQCEETRT